MTETQTKRKGKQATFTYVGGKYPGVCFLTVKGEQVWYAKYTTKDRASHFERIGTASERWTKGKVKDERAARKLGLSKTNAQRKADAKAAAEAKVLAIASNDMTASTTFGEYAATWLDRKRKGLKFSTVEDYASALNAHILPRLGKIPLAKVTYAMLEDFVADLAVSAKRTNNVVGVAKGIFASAVKRGDLAVNPAEKIERQKETRPETDPLSFPEVKAFLANVDPYYLPYFMTAFFTGARPNELFALKWSNVDFENRAITIREGRVRGQEGPPKTLSSYRDIDLRSPLFEILRQHRMKSPAEATHVFVGKRLGGPLEVGNLRADIWYPTLKKASLRRRTMYQTRHTFASLALQRGEDISWVSKTLGHATLAMVYRHYAKFIRNRQQQDGAKFSAGFLEVNASPKAIVASNEVAS